MKVHIEHCLLSVLCLASIARFVLSSMLTLQKTFQESWRSNSESAYSSLLSKYKTYWGRQKEPIDDAASLYFVLRGCLAGMCNSFGRDYLMRELTHVHPRHMTLPALKNGLLGVLDYSE